MIIEIVMPLGMVDIVIQSIVPQGCLVVCIGPCLGITMDSQPKLDTHPWPQTAKEHSLFLPVPVPSRIWVQHVERLPGSQGYVRSRPNRGHMALA